MLFELKYTLAVATVTNQLVVDALLLHPLVSLSKGRGYR